MKSSLLLYLLWQPSSCKKLQVFNKGIFIGFLPFPQTHKSIPVSQPFQSCQFLWVNVTDKYYLNLQSCISVRELNTILASVMPSLFYRVYLFFHLISTIWSSRKDFTQIEYIPDISREYISLNSLAKSKIK